MKYDQIAFTTSTTSAADATAIDVDQMLKTMKELMATREQFPRTVFVAETIRGHLMATAEHADAVVPFVFIGSISIRFYETLEVLMDMLGEHVGEIVRVHFLDGQAITGEAWGLRRKLHSAVMEAK